MNKKEVMQPRLERLREVEQFTSEALERYPELIKSIVLVGSVARGDFKHSSDTDVLVVLDDSRQPITRDSCAQIRGELVGIARKLSKRIYVVDPPISTIQLIRNAKRCNPYVYIVLKEGVAIYDRDFFVPFQKSFRNAGKFVRSSYLSKSLRELSGDLKKVELNFRRGVRVEAPDYTFMVPSSQLLLMGMGVEPPTPMKIYDAVEEHLVKPGLLERKYANWLKRTVEGIKRLEHYPGRYSIRCVSNARQRLRMVKRFVREMQRLFTAHVKPNSLILIPDGGEELDHKFPKDKSLSVSKNVVKELSERLYLTRRELLKWTGVGTVAVSTGCIEPIESYLKQREREKRRIKPKELEGLEKVDVLYFNGSEKKLYSAINLYYDENGYQVFFDSDNIVYDPPKESKKFLNKLIVRGDEEFRSNIKNMLSVLREYSPEWYEKTMYAGEVIIHGPAGGSENGEISIYLPASNHILDILATNGTFPHEVQHVIDLNVWENRKEDIPLVFPYARTGLELELRAGIAEAIYEMEVSKKVPEYYDYLGSEQGYPGYFKTRNIVNEFYTWRFHIFKEYKQKVDQVKYKDRLDKIEQMYFDHENKRLKADFLNESWQEFKKLYL